MGEGLSVMALGDLIYGTLAGLLAAFIACRIVAHRQMRAEAEAELQRIIDADQARIDGLYLGLYEDRP